MEENKNIGDHEERPLITFALFAYNQEQFIREAIEGAFCQTHSPLEIILSDDCSSDHTFQIIQESKAAYSGPHRVVLSRNEENLGIGGHINHIMELAHGELIVIAAGDDISLPKRVESTWQAYLDSGRRAMSIYSAQIIIDERGRQGDVRLGILVPELNDICQRIRGRLIVGVTGASHAWHRKVFDIFGPLLEETVNEDAVIPFRAGMLGTIESIHTPQVLHRLHANCISGMGGRLGEPDNPSTAYLVQRAITGMQRRLLTLENYRKDIQMEHEEIKIDPDLRERLRARIEKELIKTRLNVRFAEGGFSQRLSVLASGIRQRLGVLECTKLAAKLVLPFFYPNWLRKQHMKKKRYAIQRITG